MISTIQGILLVKTPTSIVIETSGIGFQLSIPLSTFETLVGVGQKVKLFTHLHVREDALQLYGFASEKERSLFLLLLSVTGIGPKVAQGILSGISVEEFASAVGGQDAQALVRIPGVGKKTADRLVLELREKIEEFRIDEKRTVPAGESPLMEEAVQALVSLGYKRAQAHETIQSIVRSQPQLPIEDVLRKALQTVSR
jgi:Holliday junction DNA helicase RuvA